MSWPNIILDVKGGGDRVNFVLIDFDYAHNIGEKCPPIKSGKWDTFGDTHQVALMITRWMETLYAVSHGEHATLPDTTKRTLLMTVKRKFTPNPSLQYYLLRLLSSQ